ncbi:hypothetical protein EVAR_69124_1 [Eumeta japonica]|uniref:Uncharacterized protein n=1 Tax=Eumeta variegata TaxID=151549 RepID=A0A4C1SC23_EUMVA|nr:hypothetical protein EVAR_69124_1 [Eumeta japonica]
MSLLGMCFLDYACEEDNRLTPVQCVLGSAFVFKAFSRISFVVQVSSRHVFLHTFQSFSLQTCRLKLPNELRRFTRSIRVLSVRRADVPARPRGSCVYSVVALSTLRRCDRAPAAGVDSTRPGTDVRVERSWRRNGKREEGPVSREY